LNALNKSSQKAFVGEHHTEETIMNLLTIIESWLATLHLGSTSSAMLARIILAVAVLIISFLAFAASRLVVRRVVHYLFQRTRSAWDDRLQENRLLLRITLFVPALIIYLFLTELFSGYPQAQAVSVGIINIYFIIVGTLVLDAFINTLHDIYQSFQVSAEIPLKGFSQVLKIFLYGTALILVVSVILDRSPLYLLSGLGALTAVLMLIFKDPILGFTAGLQ